MRAWDRRRYVFDHAGTNAPTAADKVETFSIMELIYHLATNAPVDATATLVVDKQNFPGFADETGVWHFIFSPKDAKTWSYTIKSAWPALDGQTGGFTSYWPPSQQAAQPSSRYPNWWTDAPDSAVAEDRFSGAKTVSQWRVDFLHDFATRMERCQAPAAK